MISWSLRLGGLNSEVNLAQIYAWQRQYFIGFADCWHTTSPSILQKNKLSSVIEARRSTQHLQSFQTSNSLGEQENLLMIGSSSSSLTSVARFTSHADAGACSGLSLHTVHSDSASTCFYHCVAPICGSYLWTRPAEFLHEYIINIQILIGQVNWSDEIITQPEQFDMEHTFIYFRSLGSDDHRCQLMYMEVYPWSSSAS